MPSVATSLLLALGQLADGRVLRILFKSLAVSVVLFVLVAVAGWYALDWLLAVIGLEDALFAGAGGVRGALSFALSLLGLWLTWRIVAMAVIQFYADEVVAAVEARHYPHAAAAARDLPVSRQVSTSLAAAGRALLVNLVALPLAVILLFTAIGPAILFWLVNALLLGRELQDMVWLRHVDTPAVEPVGRGKRFLLGGAIAALLAVPFANFLAPVLGAAAATHLIHRKRKPE